MVVQTRWISFILRNSIRRATHVGPIQRFCISKGCPSGSFVSGIRILAQGSFVKTAVQYSMQMLQINDKSQDGIRDSTNICDREAGHCVSPGKMNMVLSSKVTWRAIQNQLANIQAVHKVNAQRTDMETAAGQYNEDTWNLQTNFSKLRTAAKIVL